MIASPTVGTGSGSTCPSCGAPIRFGGAHSLAVVCGYCRSAVARRGADLSLVGKVPDLVASDRRLALGMQGRLDGKGFTLIGHLQLARLAQEAGDEAETDAPWDEWYAAFTDGSWGWLAEAEGHLYATRPERGRAPTVAWEALSPGQPVTLPGLGAFTVEEVAQSRFVAAEGELPFSPALGSAYRFADLTDAGGRFVTLDYGAPGDEAQVFAGRGLDYRDAGLAAAVSAAQQTSAATGGPREEAERLACPNCNAPLPIRNKDSLTIACPSCRSLLDRGAKGLRVLFELASRGSPVIPLGSRGELDGEVCEVLGWMRRSTTVDGTRYFWDEYLLHGAGGYRWLTESDGQYHLVSSIDAGKVTGAGGGSAVCGGKLFLHFQSAQAKYDELQGEFYWRVRADHSVETADYVAPPYLLSSEKTSGEITWSLGKWLPAETVWKSLRLPGAPPASSKVGAAQPNPFEPTLRSTWVASGLSLVALLGGCLMLLPQLRGQTVLDVEVPIAVAPPAPLAPNLADPTVPDPTIGPPPAPDPVDHNVFVSEPFTLSGDRQAVSVSAYAAVDNAWVALDTALINDDTGESDAAGVEISYYHGYSGGESWSEGSQSGSATIGGVKGGRYVLRVEPQSGKDPRGTLPDMVHVTVVRGVFLWLPPVLAAVLLLFVPFFWWVRKSGFERRRWEDSDHPMSSGSSGDSE